MSGNLDRLARADRVSARHPDADLFLSATARLIDKLEPELDERTPEDALLGAAFRQCR